MALTANLQGRVLMYVFYFFVLYNIPCKIYAVISNVSCRALAVAYPSTPWHSGQRQSGSFSLARAGHEYRIDSVDAIDKKGGASSDIGDTAPTVGNEQTPPTRTLEKKHGAVGLASSIQVHTARLMFFLYAYCDIHTDVYIHIYM